MARALRAIAFAALAAALQLGVANAQTAPPDPGESQAKTTEETAKDAGQPTPTAAKASPVKPSKQTSKPFKPSERIEAESVVSFPANI